MNRLWIVIFALVHFIFLAQCSQKIQNFICVKLDDANPTPYYSYDLQKNWFKIGNVGSGSFIDNFFEDDYKIVKTISPGEVTLNQTVYAIADDYNMDWVDEKYLIDCDKIKPIEPSQVDPIPINPSANDPTKDEVNGWIIFLAVFLITAVLVSLSAMGYYFYKKRRSVSENNKGLL